MPRGDGAGPLGMGPMTGRRAGYCAGFGVPGYLNPGFGYGAWYGRGCGRGWGFCRGFSFTAVPGRAPAGYPVYGGAYTPAGTEREYLNQQVEILEDQLEQVKKRLQEIDEEEK